jgi:hypothetical protein
MNQTNLTTVVTRVTIPSVGFTWATLSRACLGPFPILTNVVNIAVFLNPKLKDDTYKYLIFKSIANFFYSLFAWLNVIFTNCPTCATPQTYFACFFSLWFGNFIQSPLVLFRAILDNIISLYTFCILKNLNWFKRLPSYKYITLISLIISTILSMYIPFGSGIISVVDNNGNTKYLYRANDFFNTSLFQTVAISFNSLRYFLAVFLLTFLNVLNAIGFRKRYKKRTIGAAASSNSKNPSTLQTVVRKQTVPNQMVHVEETIVVTEPATAVNNQQNVFSQVEKAKKQENSKAIKNIIRMVIFVSFLNVLGTVMSIVNFLFNTSKLVSITSQQFTDFTNVSAIILYLTPGLDILMYYLFNKNFRDVLKAYVKKIFFFL